jgi:hypothetical protein
MVQATSFTFSQHGHDFSYRIFYLVARISYLIFRISYLITCSSENVASSPQVLVRILVRRSSLFIALSEIY